MKALNLSPLYGSMVGAERLIGALENALRMPDEATRRKEFARFVADLHVCADFLKERQAA